MAVGKGYSLAFGSNENMGSNSGAYIGIQGILLEYDCTGESNQLLDLPGGTRRRRKGKHCGCT